MFNEATAPFKFDAMFKKTASGSSSSIVKYTGPNASVRTPPKRILLVDVPPLINPPGAQLKDHVLGGSTYNLGKTYAWEDDGSGNIAGKTLIKSTVMGNSNISITNPHTDSWLPEMDLGNGGTFKLQVGKIKIFDDGTYKDLISKAEFKGKIASIPYSCLFEIKDTSTTGLTTLSQEAGPNVTYHHHIDEDRMRNSQYCNLQVGMKNLGIGKLQFFEKTALQVGIKERRRVRQLTGSLANIVEDRVAPGHAKGHANDYSYSVIDSALGYHKYENATSGLNHNLYINLEKIFRNQTGLTGAGPGEWEILVRWGVFNKVNPAEIVSPPSSAEYLIEVKITMDVPSTYYQLGQNEPRPASVRGQTTASRGPRQ